MSPSRRDFLASVTSAAALAVAGGSIAPHSARANSATRPDRGEPPAMDPVVRELLLEALDAARRGGAEFADARLSRYRNSSVTTRERQIVNVAEGDTMGVGVRVLVQGTWGFGATRELTKGGVAAAAREAVAIARANRLPEADRVRLAPAPVVPDGR